MVFTEIRLSGWRFFLPRARNRDSFVSVINIFGLVHLPQLEYVRQGIVIMGLQHGGKTHYSQGEGRDRGRLYDTWRCCTTITCRGNFHSLWRIINENDQVFLKLHLLPLLALSMLPFSPLGRHERPVLAHQAQIRVERSGSIDANLRGRRHRLRKDLYVFKPKVVAAGVGVALDDNGLGVPQVW